jgi:hypothetical protein
MSTQQPAKEALPGDYYGTIYKGGILLPILAIVLVAGFWWWYLNKRK